MASGAFASVILLLLGPSGVVIAADALVNRTDSSPSRRDCKLVHAQPHVVFGVTGTGRFNNPSFDPYDLAIEVGTNASLVDSARQYEQRAAPTLRRIWTDIRAVYLQFNGHKDPIVRAVTPHSYIFAGIDRDGVPAAAGGEFVEEPGNPGVLVFREFQFRATSASDVFLWRSGSHEAMPSDTAATQMIQKLGGPETLKLMIETQSRATPHLVGPPVAVRVISRGGEAYWYAAGVCGGK